MYKKLGLQNVVWKPAMAYPNYLNLKDTLLVLFALLLVLFVFFVLFRFLFGDALISSGLIRTFLVIVLLRIPAWAGVGATIEDNNTPF